MRSALVTGGLGCIGARLARLLAAQGCAVTVVDNALPGGGAHRLNLGDAPGIRIIRADCAEPTVAADAVTGVDAVFHCAAQTGHLASLADPLADLGANVAGTLALLQACRRRNPGVRFVLASTRQVYGRPQRLPVAEDHPLQPPDVNAIHKRCAEEHVLLQHRLHGLPAAVVRLTNVYGPGMRVVDGRQMFLGGWIRAALEDRAIEVFGDGSQRRDLLHADDAAAALLAAADPAAAGQVLNAGRPEAVSLLELARLLVGCAGAGRVATVPWPAERRAIDIGDYCTDARRLEALGWRARIALADGLGATVDHYRRHLPAYLAEAA